MNREPRTVDQALVDRVSSSEDNLEDANAARLKGPSTPLKIRLNIGKRPTQFADSDGDGDESKPPSGAATKNTVESVSKRPRGTIQTLNDEFTIEHTVDSDKTDLSTLDGDANVAGNTEAAVGSFLGISICSTPAIIRPVGTFIYEPFKPLPDLVNSVDSELKVFVERRWLSYNNPAYRSRAVWAACDQERILFTDDSDMASVLMSQHAITGQHALATVRVVAPIDVNIMETKLGNRFVTRPWPDKHEGAFLEIISAEVIKGYIPHSRQLLKRELKRWLRSKTSNQDSDAVTCRFSSQLFGPLRKYTSSAVAGFGVGPALDEKLASNDLYLEDSRGLGYILRKSETAEECWSLKNVADGSDEVLLSPSEFKLEEGIILKNGKSLGISGFAWRQRTQLPAC